MNFFGNSLILVSLIASVVSGYAYYRASKSKSPSTGRARTWLQLSAVSIITSSCVLLLLLIRHDFTNGYVYSYSSRDLPFHFLLSSFYAGQEGSFLFWALCSAIIGLALMRYTGKRKSEPWVMAVYAGVQAFLLLLVLTKTPFAGVWSKIPQIPPGQIPPDGAGLNPLLQNFWMVIHPPVLFIGFAAMAVPFSFAIASMWKKDYALLSVQSSGWLLFVVLVLGAGIMLGAYWAYGVLGWGGYWGWDPVENSSLVPWLTALALVHTLIVQKKTGKYLRTNMALAISSFLLVVYSTFLTRSGVLGDSSVHAFTDPGAGVYWLLLAFLSAVSLLGFGFMVVRRKELRPAKTDNQFVSRETALAAGTIALMLSAAVILFGTSLPLLGKSTVDASFYNTMNLPLVMVMALFIGVSLHVQWGMDEGREVLRRVLRWLVVAILGAGALFFFGLHDPGTLGLVMTSLFAMLVNIEFTWKQGKSDLWAIGGKLSHIGLAIFLMGMIASGNYSSTRHIALALERPLEVLGHTLTYVGYTETPDGKYAFHVDVQGDGKSFRLSPVMFDGGRQGTMRNPDIASFLTRDFYISPTSLEEAKHDQGHQAEVYTIEKGKTISVGLLKATFVKFDMSAHTTGTMTEDGGGEMVVGSVLELTDGKTKETITPGTVYGRDGRQTARPSESKLLNGSVHIVSMNVGGMGGTDASSITVGIQRGRETDNDRDVLVVEASLKPFISLVWAGTIVMLAGFLMAMVRRLKEH